MNQSHINPNTIAQMTVPQIMQQIRSHGDDVANRFAAIVRDYVEYYRSSVGMNQFAYECGIGNSPYRIGLRQLQENFVMALPIKH